MGTTIADLPQLALEAILQYLPVSDRLNCARTWRRWNDCNPRLFDDVWLFIPGSEMAAAGAILSKSHRQYRKLRLSRIELCDYNPEFWRKLGGTLRELVIRDCSRLSAVLYTILRDCPMLESLEISNPGGPTAVSSDELPNDISVGEIRQSMSNLRHLRLDVLLEGQTFDRLMELIPNLSSISLSKLNVPDAFKLLRLLSTTSVKITELTSPALGFSYWRELIRASTSSLQTLHTDGDFIDFEAIGDCTELRHLRVGGYPQLSNAHLEKILRNNPRLETFSFDRSGSHSIFKFAAIFGLTNLQSLSLSGLQTITVCMVFHSRKLGRVNLPTLEDLALEVRVDAKTLRSIAQLPNLRALRVNISLWDQRCVEILFQEFQNLTKLDLGDCEELPDAYLVELRKFKELKSLRFRTGGQFTDLVFRKGLVSVALETLGVWHSPLTDVGLAGIGAHHRRLKTFELVGCVDVTDDGLNALLRCLPLLETLKLENNSLSDEFLESLKNLYPRLRSVDISGGLMEKADAAEISMARRPAVDAIH